MNDMLYNLLLEWPDLDSALSTQLRSMPQYTVLNTQLEAVTRQLEASLGPDGDKAYLRFEAAANAMNSLLGDAGFLCGFRFCARLLTGILFTA